MKDWIDSHTLSSVLETLVIAHMHSMSNKVFKAHMVYNVYALDTSKSVGKDCYPKCIAQ